MYNFWIFLHVTGVAVWLGAMVAVAVFFFILKKSLVSAETRKLFIKFTKAFNAISHATATLVLVSGVSLIVVMNLESKPFYILFMERVGTMAILASIVALTIFGKRIVKRLENEPPKEATQVKGFGAYLGTMATTISFVIATIAIVAFKL